MNDRTTLITMLVVGLVLFLVGVALPVEGQEDLQCFIGPRYQGQFDCEDYAGWQSEHIAPEHINGEYLTIPHSVMVMSDLVVWASYTVETTRYDIFAFRYLNKMIVVAQMYTTGGIELGKLAFEYEELDYGPLLHQGAATQTTPKAPPPVSGEQSA